MLERRIDLMLALPIASLDQIALRDQLQAIGYEADDQ
jgi:arsenate reductase